MAHILVVDDNASILLFIKRMLEEVGHTCTTCDSVDNGLAAMRQATFDLVMTDIVMPDREGIEFIREMRAAAPDLVILAMSGTGIGKHDVLNMALHLGASATIPKPFRRQELLDLVNGLLNPPAR
jgi:DNA-binding response OmpR family regulator